MSRAETTRIAGKWFAGLGLFWTALAVVNLWRVELEGCDPGNPPETCDAPYVYFFVSLTVLGAGLVAYLTGRLMGREKNESALEADGAGP